MSFYWVYDLPEWFLGVLMTTSFVALSSGGVLLTRRPARRLFGQQGMNEIVSYFLTLTGVFYGLTLGLIAVGAWETYTSVSDKVSNEAAALGTICQDVRLLPDSPEKTQLNAALKEVTRDVIDQDWPSQRKGQIPKGGTANLEAIIGRVTSLKTSTEMDRIVVAQIYSRLNSLIELRRLRLESVTSGIPPLMYWVVFIGGLINIGVTWCFVVEQSFPHTILCGATGALIGLLIFVVVGINHPLRGDYSIGPDAFEIVFDRYFSS